MKTRVSRIKDLFAFCAGFSLKGLLETARAATNVAVGL